MDGLIKWGATPADVAATCKGVMVYVATPYSLRTVDARGVWCQNKSMDLGIEAAFQVARLQQLGVSAWSPIVSSAMVCDVLSEMAGEFGQRMIDPMDADFWEGINAPLLAASQAVVVPDLPGWDASAGVMDEIHAALRAGKPVYMYTAFRAGVI